jgi:hypothetical protein
MGRIKNAFTIGDAAAHGVAQAGATKNRSAYATMPRFSIAKHSS